MKTQPSYAVSVLTQNAIELDGLPVAKITHYPLERRDYKPYAQVVLGLDTSGLHFRLASFEVKPAADSYIGMVLYLFPQQPDSRLCLWATPSAVTAWIDVAGQSGLPQSGGTLPLGENLPLLVEANARNGGDLQGDYWGYDGLISRQHLEEFSRIVTVEDGALKGNFYKIAHTEREHDGSFARNHFTRESLFKSETMTQFPLVSY